MFALPWAQTDLNKKIQSYAGKNLASTFEFAQKLTRAKDLQELVQIQTEFMQTQLKALNQQAQDLGDQRSRDVRVRRLDQVSLLQPLRRDRHTFHGARGLKAVSLLLTPF
jgi:hypothetical protein